MADHFDVLIPDSAPDSSSPLRWQLRCPECGADTVDRRNFGPDHEAVTVHPDRDEYDSPMGTRGGYLQVDLQCSSGHEFSLILANHKGAEFLGIVRSEQ